MFDTATRDFVRQDVLARFLRYVRIHTTSDERSRTKPSTPGQWDLLRLLEAECHALGLDDVHLSTAGAVYATLPARAGATGAPFGLLAHVDTSPEQPGAGVDPQCHAAWDGAPIRFPRDPDLVLTIDDSPELATCRGDTIITAAGDTLLGADDKAGVAEILAAVAALRRFPALPHGEVRICFTSDEEIGRGTEGLELERLPRCCYTIDGGTVGELEAECFDAWKATLDFKGVGVHPAVAYGKMVHAAAAAGRLVAALPRAESPECTREREGFFYLTRLEGGCETARVELILRDFERERNQARRALLEELCARVQEDTPGLRIEIDFREQYRNMREGIARHPELLERARAALRDAGIAPREHPIRGGTDGSLLTQLGHPTPNLFTGGQLAHSRREWVALGSLCAASETIIHLARHWA